MSNPKQNTAHSASRRRYYRGNHKNTKNEATSAQPAPQNEPVKPAAPAQPSGPRRWGNASKKKGAQTSFGNDRSGKKNAPAVLPVRITPLGGLNEIGKNITLLEYGEDAVLIDCGMSFPDDDMLGVDVVLPDFSHVFKMADRIRGIVITHGHEDHIGALPYLLKQMKVPVYGCNLTIALIASKLREHGLDKQVSLNVVGFGGRIRFGAIEVEFIPVNHSIPDAVALAFHTPAGVVLHTGDFKIDSTPVAGPMIDLTRFGELGKEGVLALLADSTNAERPGYTPSEQVVGESFSTLFRKAQNKRIIVASFSSNLNRIQQIINASVREGRKVAISGRSMENFVNISHELGYLHVPDGLLIDLDLINRYPKDKVTLITTGSQGEPMSALSRMAFSDHRKVEVGPDDMIIISATPIPGNEKMVGRVINELMKRGCDVVYEKMYDVHVSGHACQGELRLIHALVRPRYFIPVHGEQKHLQKHAALAVSMGMEASRVLVTDIGKVIELTADKMAVVGSVPAGRVLVDGLGIGDVGSIVLRDRKHLAEDGIIIVVASIDPVLNDIVAGPDIVSRGFVYVREAEDLMEQCRKVASDAISRSLSHGRGDWAAMKGAVRDDLSRMLFQKTKRSPMILPIIMEV